MKYVFIFFLFFIYCGVYGQEYGFEDSAEIKDEDISRVHFVEGNFSMYAPLDRFSEKIQRGVLYGFSLSYLVQLQKEKPSFFGVDIFHMNLGQYSKSYDALIGADQLELTGKVSSNALGLNLIYRYYPPLRYGSLEPYIEGQFGGKWLYTYLSETGVFLDDDTYDNFDFISGNWVLTYGGAIGLQVHISDIYFLNLKSTYHFAVSGEYDIRKTEDLGIIDFPQEAFESVQSSTNVVRIDVGFTVLF